MGDKIIKIGMEIKLLRTQWQECFVILGSNLDMPDETKVEIRNKADDYEKHIEKLKKKLKKLLD